MFNQMDYTELERRARLSASATKRSTATRKPDTARCQSAGQTADGYGKEANSSNFGDSSTKHTTTMKANIIYIAYGLVFLLGMFGLFAIAESDLSLAATLYGIAGIFAVLYFGAKGINKLERE